MRPVRAFLHTAARIGSVIGVALTAAGCGQMAAPPVEPTAAMTPVAETTVVPPNLDDVDPQTIFARLSSEAQLAAAAIQLATALNVPPEAVRARLQPRASCTLCDMASTQGTAGMAGLDVAAAAEALAPGDGVYLFVGRFTCYYKFDGATLTPQSCQLAPL